MLNYKVYPWKNIFDPKLNGLFNVKVNTNKLDEINEVDKDENITWFVLIVHGKGKQDTIRELYKVDNFNIKADDTVNEFTCDNCNVASYWDATPI